MQTIFRYKTLLYGKTLGHGSNLLASVAILLRVLKKGLGFKRPIKQLVMCLVNLTENP